MKIPYLYIKLANLINSWEEKQVSPKVFGKLLSDRFRLSKTDIKPLMDELESLGIAIRKPKSIRLGESLDDRQSRQNGTNPHKLRNLRKIKASL